MLLLGSLLQLRIRPWQLPPSVLLRCTLRHCPQLPHRNPLGLLVRRHLLQCVLSRLRRSPLVLPAVLLLSWRTPLGWLHLGLLPQLRPRELRILLRIPLPHWSRGC